MGEAVLANGSKRTAEEVSDSLRWLGEIVIGQARRRVFEVWAAQAVLDLPKSPHHAHAAMLNTYDRY